MPAPLVDINNIGVPMSLCNTQGSSGNRVSLKKNLNEINTNIILFTASVPYPQVSRVLTLPTSSLSRASSVTKRSLIALSPVSQT